MARLHYFHCPSPNFGDELNPWIWPKLLPGLLDDSADELFLGIGTILNDSVPDAPRKIVFGSGYGYGRPPRIEPEKWRIHCVRGPLTAKALGLPAALAICDPAILLRRMPWPRMDKQYPISYMPHWESLDSGHWQVACAEAGIHFVDPTGPVEQVVAQLRASGLLITEAMHGAITADALRIPWIAVQPQLHMHSPKWLDWCASVAVVYQPHELKPSGYREFFNVQYRLARERIDRGRRAVAGLLGHSTAGRLPQIAVAGPGAEALPQPPVKRPAAAARAALQNALARRLDPRFIRVAAGDLRRIARAPPTLSADTTIERVTQRLEEQLVTLGTELAAGLSK